MDTAHTLQFIALENVIGLELMHIFFCAWCLLAQTGEMGAVALWDADKFTWTSQTHSHNI